MGKIENWSRRKDLESKNYPKVWQNDVTGEGVAINKITGIPGRAKYEVIKTDTLETPVSYKDFETTLEREIRSQSIASRKATSWMKKNPGDEMTEERMRNVLYEAYGEEYSEAIDAYVGEAMNQYGSHLDDFYEDEQEVIDDFETFLAAGGA